MNRRVKVETKTRTQKVNSNTYKAVTDIKVNGRKVGTETTTMRFK